MMKLGKLTITLAVLAFVATGCTKKREASFPDEMGEQVFAISEFGGLEADSSSSMQLDVEASQLSYGELARASNEKGAVRADSASVPGRLQFMFKGLEIQGTPGKSYPVVFAVDRDYVTAYKVANAEELSILERELSTTAPQVQAELSLQKTKDSKVATQLKAQAKSAKEVREKSLRDKRAGNLLVPIFKFKVEGYGNVERVKNDLKEETSTLQLRSTDWSVATHIKISNNVASRLNVGVEPSARESLAEVFVANKVNNKIMTAGQLRDELLIPTNLTEESKVLTLLDSKNLVIFEITSISKLSEAEQQILKSKVNNGRIQKCSIEVQASVAEADRANCVVVRRYEYPISYVKPELPEVSWEGTRSNALILKDIRPQDSIGLIRIAKNQESTRVVNNGELDPRNTIKIADIKNKEFFFRRSALASTSTAPIPSGMGGPLLIVKMELQEKRIVVKRVDQVVEFFRDQRDLDKEEIMSIPATYHRLQTKDDSGNMLAIPRLVESTKEEADYVQLDWTNNTIPNIYSPMSFYGQGQCIASVGNQKVTDVDLNLEQGVLSFSLETSATMVPSYACVSLFYGQQGYAYDTEPAMVQKFQERISFKTNDGSTDKAFVESVPFAAQNALGYGVFTTARLNPSSTGNIGREGQELNYPFVHDFRDKKKMLTYVIGGLPEAEGRTMQVEQENIDMRELYIELTKEVVAEWNKALQRAFKGTDLQREGDYINVVIKGENDASGKLVTGELGDLDKNFIWYEETINESTGYGISQNAVNPRSGVSVADFVTMYTGNFRRDLVRQRKNQRIVDEYNRMTEEVRKNALNQPNVAPKASEAAPAAAVAAPVSAESKKIIEEAEGRIEALREIAEGTFAENIVAKSTGTILRTAKMNQLASGQGVQDLAKKLRETLGVKKDVDVSQALGDRAFLHKIVQQVMKLDPTQRQSDVELITATEILNAFGSKMSIGEKNAMKAKVSVLTSRKRLAELTQKFPGCNLPSRDALNTNYNTATFREALKRSLKWALTHEMGHSLGLTHNFKGNVDSANFKFADEKQDPRSSSSVMDYLDGPDRHFYAGPGPYDVHALRTAYTGRVELQDGKETTLDAVKKSAKGEWGQVTPAVAAALKVKPYKYCTDINVMWEPTCTRFDEGANALEIVKSIKTSYDNLYRLNFTGWDRLEFSWSQMSAAINYSMMYMLDARIFMDEFIYKAITRSAPGNEINEHAMAAVEAYKFLTSIITTPDSVAGTRYADRSRFVAYPYVYRVMKTDANGQPVADAAGNPVYEEKRDVAVIEKKSLQTLSTTSERFDTIGVEYNKILAMQVLALKGYPHPKYDQLGLTLSYLDFEKLLLGITDPMQSPVLTSMLGMLKEDLRPTLTTDKTFFQPLPASTFKSEVTNAMRSYAGIVGILALESTSLKDTDNFANLFKVGSTKGTPVADRVTVSKLGSPANSSQKINYFAVDNATIAGNLVTEATRWNFYLSNDKPLKASLKVLLRAQIDLIAAKKAKDEAKIKAATEAIAVAEIAFKQAVVDSKADSYILSGDAKADLVAEINRATEMIKAFNEQTFSEQMHMLVAIVGYATFLQENDQQVPPQIANGAAQAMGLLTQVKATMDQAIKRSPLVSFGQDVVVEVAKELAVEEAKKEPAQQDKYVIFFALGAENAVSPMDFETKYGMILNSIDFLHMLTRLTNPEYSQQ